MSPRPSIATSSPLSTRATANVYTVYWAASGDLVAESAPSLGDGGVLKRDLIVLARSPGRPLAVWFPAGPCAAG